jgi:hypothetical protein
LWWTPDMATFSTEDKSQWDWTLMIAVPELVTADVVEDARAAAARKHPRAPLDAVRLERLAEGRCAQVLHVGPYSTEGPTVAALHAFIARVRVRPRGQAPRDLPGRPAPERTGETPDDRAATGRARVLIADIPPATGAERTDSCAASDIRRIVSAAPPRFDP